MDNIIDEDSKIAHTWKIESTFNINTRHHEIGEFNSHSFPRSGKYADKFELTFNKNEESDNYSYYLDGPSIIQKTIHVCFSMLRSYQVYKLIEPECMQIVDSSWTGVIILDNDYIPKNMPMREIKRKLTYTCSGDQLFQIGFPEFCSAKDLPPPSDVNTAFCITLGCEITFREQSVYLSTTNSLLRYKSMQNQFKQLLISNELSDFTIVADAQEMKVHKAILAARSPVFKTMLAIDMAEKKTNQLVIKDIDPKILKLMIEFIYTNKIDDELNPNEAEKLLIVADKYQLEDLKDLCTHFLRKSLNTINITQYMLLAARYKNKSLMDAVIGLMKSDQSAIDIACKVWPPRERTFMSGVGGVRRIENI